MRRLLNVSLTTATLTLISAAGLHAGTGHTAFTPAQSLMTSGMASASLVEDVSIRLGKRGRNRTWRGTIGKSSTKRKNK